MCDALLPMLLDMSSICQRVLAKDICNFPNRGTIVPCPRTCHVNVFVKIKFSCDITQRDHYKKYYLVHTLFPTSTY